MHRAAGRKWLCKAFPEAAEDGALNRRYIFQSQERLGILPSYNAKRHSYLLKSDGFHSICLNWCESMW